MIVVTTGTNERPFDRLVRAAAALAIDEQLLVQYGSSRVAHGEGEWVDFLSFEDLADAMRRARVVVSHAGVGSIMLARSCGKTPIVVPRLLARAEAVDDHQLHLGRRLAALGLLTLIEDESRLGDAVHRASAPAVATNSFIDGSGTLVAELEQYFSACGAARSATGDG